jgi:ATP/maltotriose-dependent transcriptional regulator MalT
MTTTTQLTCREVEVLQLLARGCSYSQVGDRLGISLHTVTSHIKNVYRKLKVHSARAAVWRATELRLFGKPDEIAAEPESRERAFAANGLTENTQ